MVAHACVRSTLRSCFSAPCRVCRRSYSDADIVQNRLVSQLSSIPAKKVFRRQSCADTTSTNSTMSRTARRVGAALLTLGKESILHIRRIANLHKGLPTSEYAAPVFATLPSEGAPLQQQSPQQKSSRYLYQLIRRILPSSRAQHHTSVTISRLASSYPGHRSSHAT